MSILKGVEDQIEIKVEAVFDTAKGMVKAPFTAIYKRRNVNELEEMSVVLRQQSMDEYADLIKGSVVGWRSLEGKNGEAIPFSDDMLDEMVTIPEYLAALIQGMGEASGNPKGTRIKN
jgi:hypothetical protein